MRVDIHRRLMAMQASRRGILRGAAGAGQIDPQASAAAIAAAWKRITDQIGRESRIALYKASPGLRPLPPPRPRAGARPRLATRGSGRAPIERTANQRHHPPACASPPRSSSRPSPVQRAAALPPPT
jgi:hypothetical protein